MWKEIIEILDTPKVILPDNNPKKPYYNPSICWYKGKLMISIRSSTWTRDENGNKAAILGALHTDVMLGELDPKTLKVKNLHKLEYAGDVHPFVKDIGLEDGRLFVKDGELHAVGVCMSATDRNGESVHLAHGVIKGNQLVFKELLQKPWPDRIEKNWTPPEEPTEAFDYILFSPTQTIKDGVLTGEPEYHGRIHGGSQAIKWEGGYLSFVHRIHRFSHDWQGLFQYVNYAMKYDKNGIATEISQGFMLFGDNQVEFISGLVLNDDKFLVSLGVGDKMSVIATIDPKELIFEHFDINSEPIRMYLKTPATDQI
jgi:predicted GH43/DUF377 family glycosyl hydrolase